MAPALSGARRFVDLGRARAKVAGCAAIDAAQRVVVLYSRDGKSTLEYDLSSPQAPRLLRMVAQAAGSATAASACEHRGAPRSTEEVTATGSLRLITRRDGTQVTGRVLQVVPQEPVTVRTASHEDVVIPWDDIRRIEELRSGPALSPEATRQRPFEPLGVGFQHQRAMDPEVPRAVPPSPNQARVAGIVIGSVLAGVVTIALPSIGLYFAFKDRSFFGNIGLY